MPSVDHTIEALRHASRLSPDNLPLRNALAESLMSCGRHEEAESEFKAALAMSPQDAGIKLSLAVAYYHQEKNSHALVIVEDLIKAAGDPRTQAKAFVLYAKLLFRSGEIARAVRQYKRGLEVDTSVADIEFAARLGVQPARNPNQPLEVPFERELHAGDGSFEGDNGDNLVKIEKPQISFKDVGGMESLKEEISLKIIHPLRHPDLYRAYGKSAGGGILMYGPPGCGKTYLARAAAGEIQAGFLIVGINDVLNMWLGNSEKNLHECFVEARQHRPCVLFFDEVDALAASRADMRASAGRHLINQFLAELDGVTASNDGVLVLAATNAPWHVDPAFRRPGRFDRVLFVPSPDGPARAAILRILLKDRPVAEIDCDALVARTADFSGADLKGVVDLAIERKLQQAIKEGIPKPLSTKDLLAAASSMKPSTREWFVTARNYASYSNQGGTYDDIKRYLRL